MSPLNPTVAPDSPTAPASAWRVFLRSADCRVIRAGLTALLGVCIARYLGPAEYGILSSAFALALMLLAFSSLGLDRLVQDEVANRPTESSIILGTAMGLRLAAAAIAYVSILLFLPDAFPGLRLVWLVAGLVVFSHIPLTVESWLRAKQQSHSCSLALNTGFVITALLNLAFISNGVSAVWFAAVMALEAPLAALFVFHAYGKLAPNEDTFDWNTALARRWLRACWPAVCGSVVTIALLQANHVLVAWLRGPAEAGHFGAATRFLELAAFALAALATVPLARIRGKADTTGPRDDADAPVLNRFAKIAWGTALVAAGTAPWLVPLLFGGAYSGASWTFGILALALPTQALGLISAAPASHDTPLSRRSLVLLSATLGLGLLLASWWIVWWGAIGAAVATLVTVNLVQWVVPRFEPATRDRSRRGLAALALLDVFAGRSARPLPQATVPPVPPIMAEQSHLPPPSAPVST